MRWFKKTSETPRLLSLSPLRVDGGLSISTLSINSIDLQNNQTATDITTNTKNETLSDIFRSRTPNHSTRKSRKGKNGP